MRSEIPQGPWYNPEIDEGIYDATIRCLEKGRYGADNDSYIQVILWLPQVEQYFVTNLYFPKGKPDAKTVKRLARLCKVIGLVPQDALDNPHYFRDCQIKVKVAIFNNGNREYRDAQLFLHPDSITS